MGGKSVEILWVFLENQFLILDKKPKYKQLA